MGATALAQTTATGSSAPAAETQTTETVNTSPAQASTPADKIIAQFTTFSGSEENAASLVNGLRTGSEITLNGSTSPGSSGETASFTSPTKPMGYGNIRIALSLAKAQLGAEGITQPTPEQLQTALMGDAAGTGATTAQTQGILQMRASGMGWGQIANTMGFKLGAVMSGRVPVNAAGTATQSGTDSTTTTTASGASLGASNQGRSASAGGIVTATGDPAGANGAGSSAAGRSKAAHGNAARSSGIVTATGGPVGSGSNSRAFSAAGNASAGATVHGGGQGASSNAVSAQGNGRGGGNAYGHTK
jgi:hypothetical protein